MYASCNYKRLYNTTTKKRAVSRTSCSVPGCAAAPEAHPLTPTLPQRGVGWVAAYRGPLNGRRGRSRPRYHVREWKRYIRKRKAKGAAHEMRAGSWRNPQALWKRASGVRRVRDAASTLPISYLYWQSALINNTFLTKGPNLEVTSGTLLI